MAFGKYGDDPVDQARALRLTLAVLDDDTWAFQQVITDVAQDERKESSVALMVALAQGLAEEFAKQHGSEAVREAIAFRLIQYEEEGK